MDKFLQAFFPIVKVNNEIVSQDVKLMETQIGAGETKEKTYELVHAVEKIRLHNEGVDTLISRADTLERSIVEMKARHQPGERIPYFAREYVVIRPGDETSFRLTDAFITSIQDMRNATNPKNGYPWRPRFVVLTDLIVELHLKDHPAIAEMDDVVIIGTAHIKIRGKIYISISEVPKEPGKADANTFGTLILAPSEMHPLPQEHMLNFLKPQMAEGSEDDVELTMDTKPIDTENPAREVKMKYAFITHRPVMKVMTVDGLR